MLRLWLEKLGIVAMPIAAAAESQFKRELLQNLEGRSLESPWINLSRV